MKAEKGDLKGSYGEISLFPENLDDLWHLAHLVVAGDLVFATTFRSLESSTDKIRPEKTEKKPVRLGIRVEKVEFHRTFNRLRIAGIIEHGVDTGSYHTLNIDAGHEVSVIKRWLAVDLERVERAVKASTAGVVHVVSIEDGEAQVFRIRQYGPEHVVTLTGGSGKREGLDIRSAFFEEVFSSLSGVTGPVVLAGPGFIKDDFLSYLRSHEPETAERCISVETRRVGRGAVQEAIGLGVLDKITEDIQLSREVRVMDEFLKRMGTDGRVAYGTDEVSAAVDYGAVETLMVSDEMMRLPEVSLLIEKAENMQAGVVIFSGEFDPGAQLLALGGIAALLRFKVQ